MAITYKSTGLDDNNPVYNPIIHVFDSNNKLKDGFRYVVEIFVTPSTVYTARITPRPGDGYGYIDVSKVLSNLVTSKFPDGFATASNNFVKYDIKIGEEYNQFWNFTDTINSTYSFPGGGFYEQLTQVPNSITHTYIIGDQIDIKQTSILIPSLEGLHTITAVPDSYNVVLDQKHIDSATNPGVSTYADNRKIVNLNLASRLNNYAFNSVLNDNSLFDQDTLFSTDFANYSQLTFDLDQAFSIVAPYLLTSLKPQDVFETSKTNYNVTLYQDITLSVMVGTTASANRVIFENSNGDRFFATQSFSTLEFAKFNCGPGNLPTVTVISGTAPVIKDNTLWYDVYVADSSNLKKSSKYRFTIDRKCEIDNTEIMFMDRMGSYLSLNFYNRSYLNSQFKRDMYNKSINLTFNENTDKITYDQKDAGFVVTNVNLEEEYTVNSGFLTNEMAQLYNELLASPYVYVKIPNSSNDYRRIIVSDNSSDLQRRTNHKLITKQLKFKFAIQNKTNY